MIPSVPNTRMPSAIPIGASRIATIVCANRFILVASPVEPDNYLLMRKQDRESTPDPTYSRARFSLTNNYCRVKNVFLRAFDIMFVDKLFVQVSRSLGVVSL